MDLLHKLGLEAPQGMELACELRLMGLDIEVDCLTEKECAEAIYSAIKKEKK